MGDDVGTNGSKDHKMKQRWMKAIEICGTYRVSASTLERYALRGNLAIKRNVQGQRLYDAHAVSRMFPRHDAMAAPRAMTLGTIGQTRLAEFEQISVLPGPALRAPVSILQKTA